MPTARLRCRVFVYSGVSVSPYRRAWIIWAILIIGGFAAIEIPALLSGDMDNTLSAHLRLVLGLEPGKWWGVLGGLAFLAFLGWAGWHIVVQRGKK